MESLYGAVPEEIALEGLDGITLGSELKAIFLISYFHCCCFVYSALAEVVGKIEISFAGEQKLSKCDLEHDCEANLLRLLRN